MATKTKNTENCICKESEPKFDVSAIARRSQRFEALFAAQKTAEKSQKGNPIRVTLSDGAVKEAKCLETTPMEIAKAISPRLAARCVLARVVYAEKRAAVVDVDAEAETDGAEQLIDLERALEGDCQLTLLTEEHPVAQRAFQHSAAHLLGAAIERHYAAYLCHGPPIEGGFFYDAFTGSARVTTDDYARLEQTALELARSDAPFERLELSKEDALSLFGDNPFKRSLIETKVADGGRTSAYRCGEFVDLCTGPHLPRTGLVGALKVTKASAAYWHGAQDLDDLQRVYGIAFATAAELEEHLRIQAELEQRDHRAVGERQKLFMFSELSPGCCFFLPHGARIYHRLVAFMRRQYRSLGMLEVETPNVFRSTLWKTSGHYFKYNENMFFLDVAGQEFGLKPMNCPAHCVIFDSQLRSRRELPLRLMDFGALHRNEASGALTGLTRVRLLHQDDGHIFAAEEQIETEISSQLELLRYVYELLGFEYSLELSTRPARYLGELSVWERAEEALRRVLEATGRPWKLNPGDGAYYGPKIDVKLYDCYRRSHQLGTIQLDFVQPLRFNLQYRDGEETAAAPAEPEPEGELPADEEARYAKVGKLKPGFKRPIIVHRAVLGSLERCIALLCEHFGGKWPFWLSPRQAVVLPVSDKFADYAERVVRRLRLEGFDCEMESGSAKLNKRIREAQLDQVNYILVVGAKEAESGTVNVRERDSAEPRGEMTLSALLAEMRAQLPPPSDFERRLISGAQYAADERGEWLVRLGLSASQLEEWERRLDESDFLDGAQSGETDRRVLSELRFADLAALGFPKLAKWRKALGN